MNIAALIVGLAIAQIATYTDLTRRRVPNALTIPAIASGVFYHVLASIDGHWDFGITGMLLGGVLLLVPYSLGLVGGGDVKLLSALGAWVGPDAVCNVFIYGTLCGTVLSVLFVVKPQWKTGLSFYNFSGKNKSFSNKVSVAKIPYAVAVNGGLLLFVLCGELL